MFNLIAFIKAAGYIGITGVIFAESGLLIGFFLPGDSLLFTAGILASQGYLNIFILVTLTFFAAVLGDSVGYAFGKKIGPSIFVKEESLFFNPENIARAQAFFSQHGPKTIVLARFIPVVRTFVPVVAGVGKMKYKTFLTYNILGAAIWALGIPFAGFYLGKTIPNIDHYLLPIIILIIVVSLLPTFISVFKDREQRAYIIKMIKKLFRR